MTDWPKGYGVIILDSVDSTNAEAARRADVDQGAFWIMAHTQTAARGRRGRAWANPKGNLAATLVLRPVGPPQLFALRSFVASLALYDALVAVTGRPEAFSLKWPNDVLLNGGKLAGILLETIGRSQALAIGIGVNLQNAPHQTEVEEGAVRPVSLVSETGADVDSETFLTELAAAFAVREQSLVTYGFGPTREAWLSRAARLGEVITARTVTSETVGTFETVDASGNLVLKTSKGRENIAAADVFF